MQTLELDLPAHWASALFYSDTSGLDDADQRAFDLFTESMVAEYGSCWCVGVSDGEGRFTHFHDAVAFDVPACDVITYTFDITQR